MERSLPIPSLKGKRMILEADKKIIDLHQEVYLAFYDLTGITVGVVLFVNMLVTNILFLTTEGDDVVFGLVSVVLTIFYFSMHVLQAEEKIKLYNEAAISWGNNYMSRVVWFFITLSILAVPGVLVGKWTPLFIMCPYMVAMYLPAVKIRERDRDRFKIVKWATA